MCIVVFIVVVVIVVVISDKEDDVDGQLTAKRWMRANANYS